MRESFSDEWDDFTVWMDEFVERSPEGFLEHARLVFRWHVKWWLISRLNRSVEVIMARGKSTSAQTAKPPKGQWTQFVDIVVGVADASKIEKAYPAGEDVFNDMAALLEGGYRVSFAYNPSNDAMVCTVTCKAEGSVNEGKTYTSFAGDWFTALKVAMYKHYHVSKGSWGGESGGGSRPAFG